MSHFAIHCHCFSSLQFKRIVVTMRYTIICSCICLSDITILLVAYKYCLELALSPLFPDGGVEDSYAGEKDVAAEGVCGGDECSIRLVRGGSGGDQDCRERRCRQLVYQSTAQDRV